MKKLSELRAHLLKSPLALSNKNLIVLAENGKIISVDNDNGWIDPEPPVPCGYLLEYTARIIITDYTGATSDLFFVVSQWTAANCFGINLAEAITFNADMINHKSTDVDISIAGITENYTRDTDKHIVPVSEKPIAKIGLLDVIG